MDFFRVICGMLDLLILFVCAKLSSIFVRVLKVHLMFDASYIEEHVHFYFLYTG